MAAVSGTAFLFKINTGTPGVPIYTLIAGQIDGTLNLNMDEIDTTSKDSSNFHTSITGTKSWSMDISGAMNEADTGLLKLEDMWGSSLVILGQFTTPAGSTWTGNCIITSYSVTGANQQLLTFSATLTGAGALTKL